MPRIVQPGGGGGRICENLFDGRNIFRILLLIQPTGQRVYIFTWRNRRLPSPTQINSSVCPSVRPSVISRFNYSVEIAQAQQIWSNILKKSWIDVNRESGIFRNKLVCNDSRKNQGNPQKFIWQDPVPPAHAPASVFTWRNLRIMYALYLLYT